ncbi:9098_t:CDS:2 [Paraglomus occultum]|uniref:9098_t:CDS:1 n=1 Tax=Paraglomus occultum TaxID=144539 RepID=A0A9N8W1E9_9GLOM|nr:9098_t:CDS:2 [Paraglomus occultum]
MSSVITHRKPKRVKSKIPAKLDFTGKNAVMVVVDKNLENSIDILESLPKELIHVEDCVNQKELAAMNNINKKELTTMSFSRLPRGRKRRTVPRELDFTGHSPVMVVEHLDKQRMARDDKEEQPFVNLDRSVDIVDFEYECKTVVNYSIDKQKLAQMTAEELRDYAKFIANKINLNQPNDCNF